MRKRSILLTSALASLALLSACGNNSGENNTQSATNDSLITSLPLSMNIKSAAKSYKRTMTRIYLLPYDFYIRAVA